MRTLLLGAAIAVAMVIARPAAAEVHLTIDNGQVTLSAKNATVPQILAEWSKVGQTKIVNGERVAATPVTLELTQVTEAQALDIILRSVTGYVLATRSDPASTPSASSFDRIYIMPATATARPVTAVPAPQANTTTFQQPRFLPPPPPPDDQSDEPRVQRPAAVVPAGVPVDPGGRSQPGFVFQATPPAPPPTNATGAPTGVSVPGMIAPPPAPPTNRDVRATQQTPQ